MTHSLTSFYMTLPSDASMELHPGNTPSSWKTKLRKPVNLPGRWEVAVVELVYPNSIYNLPVDEKIICRQITDENSGYFIMESDELKIAKGMYSKDDLIGILCGIAPPSKIFKDLPGSSSAPEPAFSFKATPTDTKVKLVLNSPRVILDFSGASHIRQMLGFTNNQVSAADSIKFEKFMAFNFKLPDTASFEDKLRAILTKEPARQFVVFPTKSINMNAGSQNLFIYSSIVDFSIVGSENLQLLTTVPIKANGPRFEPVVERFEQAHYVPVLYNVFDTIELSIATDLGFNVHFETGKSLLKLHFRPLRKF